MKKLLPIIMIIALISSGCSALLDPKKDIAIVEDVIDDVVVEEIDIDLGLGPEHQKK